MLIETRRLLKKRLKRFKYVAKSLGDNDLLRKVKQAKRDLKQMDLDLNNLLTSMKRVIALEQKCLDSLASSHNSIDYGSLVAHNSLDNSQ
jgi:hypothetical protein